MLFGNVLLTNEGFAHQRQREELRPVLENHGQLQFDSLLVDSLEKRMHRWKALGPFSLYEEMSWLTFVVSAQVLFKTDVTDYAGQLNHALGRIMIHARPGGTLSTAELFGLIPPHNYLRYVAAKASWNALVRRIITKFAAENKDTGGLEKMIFQPHSPHEKINPVLNLFLGVYGTTASAIASSLFLITKHSHIGKKVSDEVSGVPERQALPYLRHVMTETLRLYPPVPSIRRYAAKECWLGEYLIPPKSIVLVDVRAVQRDPRYYADAETFMPERWESGGGAASGNLTYFPFGVGSHRCIGESLALRLSILAVATVTKSQRLKLVSPQADPKTSRFLF